MTGGMRKWWAGVESVTIGAEREPAGRCTEPGEEGLGEAAEEKDGEVAEEITEEERGSGGGGVVGVLIGV